MGFAFDPRLTRELLDGRRRTNGGLMELLRRGIAIDCKRNAHPSDAISYTNGVGYLAGIAAVAKGGSGGIHL